MAAVHQAIWSRSTFLSCMHHNHVAMELLVTAWRMGRERSLEEADRRVRRLSGLSVLLSGTPGLERLRARFGTGAGAPARKGGRP
jgi:hypothetical protein